jgi:hypothetical protein
MANNSTKLEGAMLKNTIDLKHSEIVDIANESSGEKSL